MARASVTLPRSTTAIVAETYAANQLCRAISHTLLGRRIPFTRDCNVVDVGLALDLKRVASSPADHPSKRHRFINPISDTTLKRQCVNELKSVKRVRV